ncbi:tRNA (guanine-N(7)-)-methyltransferase non-catalytic subunit WDR4 isoform X3 [Chroicocephalus ridibundus]|uniref:tRNA (guanine-N(7)-)-methyltransferase non-catalytic subunit WDR4 isoform X3 n=1 Tax=Chroicocephalus ridibundus TaxID=1192867 RepID=UPI002FDE497D
MEGGDGGGGGGGGGRSPGHCPALALRGALMAVGGGGRLLAARYKEAGDDSLFTYDCINAEKTLGNNGQDENPRDKGSDDILAFAFSPSGDYFALTDDSKRLILFHTKPSWECVSVRSVKRRCTSLIITAADDKILIADKSGDVYSYSITEPQAEGKLELGHLSLLLDVALSADDQYILTADRDEKIRVSLAKAPYYIVSYCLGHKEFVSKILVIPNYPDLLLSASGDSTLRLWEYKSGEEVYCCHLSTICGPETTKADQPVTDDKGLQKMSKYLQDNWTVFEGFVGAERHYSSLYKASFDNMADYLQRQEERIKQQKKKRQEDLQRGSNGETKKMKTEESSL